MDTGEDRAPGEASSPRDAINPKETPTADSSRAEKGARDTPHSLGSGSLLVLNVAASLDGCDDQLLPASFRAMEAELGFHPSLLGNITLAQTMALSLSCPVWGYLADRCSRKRIMSIGLISWGAATIGLGFTSKVVHVILLRAINGMFLGSIAPISQSILADLSPRMSRGFHFGLIQMCASGGRVIGGVLMTSVAFMPIGNFYGWRWTFLCVGALSCLFGLLVAVCVNEFERLSYTVTDTANASAEDDRHQLGIEVSEPAPAGTGEAGYNLPHAATIGVSAPTQHRRDFPRPKGFRRATSRTPLEQRPLSMADFEFVHQQKALPFLCDVFKYNLRRPSVLLILLEGIMGMIPWSSLAFLTLFFQYSGLSDLKSGLAAGCLYVGAMISGPLAGLLGDHVSEYSPNHGRPTLGQLSMVFRIPLVLMAFLLMPASADSFSVYAFSCLGLGLCSIGGVVVNRPLLSDLVLPPHRATVFAITIALEGACGALLGAPLVGILAETAFGYTRTENLHLDEISDAVKLKNAYALSRALVCLTCIPWLCSLLTYGLIHCTYGRDKERLQEDYMEYRAHRGRVPVATGDDADGDVSMPDILLTRPFMYSADAVPAIGIY